MTTLPAGETLALAEDEAPRLQRGGFFFRVLRERKSAVVGLGIIIFFIVLSLVAPYISPYSATQQTCRVYAPPSPRHWLGCDDGGIDMVSLLMQGGRISLVVGFAATFVAMFIGGGVGLLSGYFGRWVDVSLMRVTDYLLVIPDLVFMTVIAAVWGASLFHVIMVIGILEWASTARIIRDIAELRTIKGQAGKNMYVVGGATLVASLLNADLIDELRLIVHPILLGGGKALFAGVNKRRLLNLVQTESTKSGRVILTYRT